MPRGIKDLRLEPPSKVHDRASFSYGVESLDTYLKTQASQDVRRKANAVFVLTAPESSRLVLPMKTLANLFASGPGISKALR
jgi:hypothetical protein